MMIKNNMGKMDGKIKIAVLSLLIAFVAMVSSCLKDNINPATGRPSDYMAITDVRALYKGEDLVLNKENMYGAKKITGVVISDADAGNIPQSYVVLQQTTRLRTRGIVLNLGNTTLPCKLGDSITVTVEGATLGRRNGVLQLVGLNAAHVEKNAENIFYEPTQVTLAELNKNFNNYESVFVKVAHVDALTSSPTLIGDISIQDIVGTKGTLRTEETAVFANKAVPLNASYSGIPLWKNELGNGTDGAKQLIYVRNLTSITDESGTLYEDFPESFEEGDASMFVGGGYGTKVGNLKAGPYTLTNALIAGGTADRPVSGINSLRLNQNSSSDSWCTMNFDLNYGASKITLWAGAYGASADLGSTWRIEYSQDGGSTWYQIGNDIFTVSKDKKQFTFLVDIKGKVRFRFGKIGIGNSTTNNQNGRFSMDDFAVYKNPNDDGTGVVVPPAYTPLFSWQFGSPQSNGTEVSYNATSVVTGIETPVLTRGYGFNAIMLIRGFSSNTKATLENGNASQLTSTKAIAISQKNYFQIDFTTISGYKTSLTAIDAIFRRSAAGAKNHAWYYSINDGEFKPTGAGVLNYPATNADEGETVPTNYLHNTAELQNMPGGTKVILRLYAWGFSNIASGSFSIGRTPLGTTTPTLSVGGKIEPE